MKFRKRPVVIEAVQWQGDNTSECLNFCPQIILNHFPNPRILMIPTLDGKMACSVGDWIIRGVSFEYYPCKPDIFEKTYEKVMEND